MYRNYSSSFRSNFSGNSPVIFASKQGTCPRCSGTVSAGQRIYKPAGSRFWVHVDCPTRNPIVARPVEPAYEPLSEADMGAYVACHDSSLVYNVRSAKGTNGTYYFGQKWTLIGGRRQTAIGEVENGEFRTKDADGNGWTRNVARWIRGGKLRKMTVEEAMAFAVLSAYCPVHGGPLKDADSVAAGVGPVCADRMGWDRKALAKAGREALAARVKAERVEVVQSRTAEQTEARYAELFGDEPAPNEPATPAEIPMALLMGNGDSAHLNDRNPRTGAGSRARRAAVRSLWSRANSDDLSAAAGYGRDEDY